MASHQPLPRCWHTSARLGSKAVVYSGWIEDRSVQNRKRLQSIVELYNPHTEGWEARPCSGEKPAPGLYGAASASSSDVLYCYGGLDGDDKFVNSLYQLSAKTYDWSKVPVKNAESESPMAKEGTGMVFCGDGLALFGGYGVPHGPTQRGSSFIKNTRLSDGRGWTNEFHIYYLNEGVWSSPATTGERPPPCAWFSLTSIDQWRAVLFGGTNGEQGWMNDIYIIDLQRMHWTKLTRSGGGPWPEERDDHAACCLNYGQQHPQLLVTGGVNRQALGDAWILEVDSGRWRKVRDTLQPRYGHSSTAINITSTLTEVILFGGEDDHNTELADTTVPQFRLKGDYWELSGVVGPTELGQSEERLREKMECAILPPGTPPFPPNGSVSKLSDTHKIWIQVAPSAPQEATTSTASGPPPHPQPPTPAPEQERQDGHGSSKNKANGTEGCEAL